MGVFCFFCAFGAGFFGAARVEQLNPSDKPSSFEGMRCALTKARGQSW
jgi:hypothetical protein